MMIGVMRLEFALHDNDSLKGKRRFVQGLKTKIRNKFNAAASEVDAQDSLGTAVLGVVTCGPDKASVEGRLQKVLNMVEAAADEDLVDVATDIFGEQG